MTLAASSRPLLEEYDALLVDIDGVVLLDAEPVPGAGPALAAARAAGRPVSFVTNNAARTPQEVAERLRAAGVDADPAEVVTSAVTAAHLLAGSCPPGAPVLVVGGAGLFAAVSAAGLRPVESADEGPVAVIQGWGPDVDWSRLAEASLAIRAGARWVATNRDRTLPSPRGPLPGSGALIAAVATATGREPDVVVGKPGPQLFADARASTGGARPLVVGDRLDTDIAGAVAAGIPALLVLTGVSTPADLLAAPTEQRPGYIGADLGSLEDDHPGVELAGGVARCRGVTVTATGEVDGRTGPTGAIDGLRAAACLAWSGALRPDGHDRVLNALGFG